MKIVTEQQKQPYIDQIHAHPKVKKLFVINEVIGFFDWITSILALVFILFQLNGIDAGVDSFDIKIMFALLMQNKTGVIILGVLFGALIIYKITKKIIRGKLTVLENEVYEEIISGGESSNLPAPKKNIAFKIYKSVQSISAIAMVGALIFSFYGIMGGGDTDGGDEGPGPYVGVTTLDTPTGLAFDSESSTLSWNNVENATGYQVDFNGSIHDVNETSISLTITVIDNTFKVKAVGDNSYYADSEWSSPITYQMEQTSLSVYEKVNIKLGEVAVRYGYEIVDVLGIKWVSLEPNKYEENIQFFVVGKKDSKTYNYLVGFACPNNNSVADMLNNFENAEFKAQERDEIVSEYTDAEYFLNGVASDQNDTSQLKQLMNAGYTITPIIYRAEKGEKVGTKFRYEMTITCKAEKDGDVKYITATYRIDILSPSTKESRNYEGFLTASKNRNVVERSFLVHEENGTMLYMSDWALANE